MTHPFVKMNGAGNDFIVVNALERPFAPPPDQARALADRQTGPAGGCLCPQSSLTAVPAVTARSTPSAPTNSPSTWART